MKTILRSATLVACISTLTLSGCASTGGSIGDRMDSAGSSAQEQREKKQATLPHCAKSLGTIAIVEPKFNWWAPKQVQSPEVLIKIYIQESGCFTVLNRGRGFDLAQQERALAGDGDLRKGSNLGKGQMKAADYLITPDIVSSNNNAGGNAVGAMAGGLIGAFIPFGGLIAGQISLSDKTAEVTLTVTDVRSGEEVAMLQGKAQKSDWHFGAGGIGAGFGSGMGIAGGSFSSYANTEQAQVLALAYLDAYTKLITKLGGLPADAAAAAVSATDSSAPRSAQASAPAKEKLAMAKPGHLFKGPSVKSGVICALPASAVIYPTTEKSGVWLEVTDESGEKGWVSSKLVAK